MKEGRRQNINKVDEANYIVAEVKCHLTMNNDIFSRSLLRREQQNITECTPEQEDGEGGELVQWESNITWRTCLSVAAFFPLCKSERPYTYLTQP